MAVHHLVREAELARDLAHLIFEQLPEGPDEPELQPLGQAADIVMSLDPRRGARAAFDDVGVKRPLYEEVHGPECGRLLLEDSDELLADTPAFLLRLDDPGQPAEEALPGVDVH